ncbi:Fur family transcriptional regulator [Autumnicola psychrophila]|uniref:Transcriptional repressor n=1 Tax=Autumnicola psychrophila TaxID=3075592 RepID=A0ABU3DUK6_9FLAO|nr:transcriptional repressor [Zunongwangia sp. F225]MDT0687385.1 transcriptional repressor [Zunongwangia sp. F225]
MTGSNNNKISPVKEVLTVCLTNGISFSGIIYGVNVKNKFKIKELEELLTAKKVRTTAMRLLVLKTLQKQKAAIGLQDLESVFEKADRITLYRTLKTFEEKGLIHSIVDGNGTTKYALCKEGCECAPKDMHVHFYCQNCRETFCLPKSKVPEVPLPEHFVPVETTLLVKGVCGKCSG